MWTESGGVRRATIASLFAEGGVYTDSIGTARGFDEIDAHVTMAQGLFPGHRIQLSSIAEPNGDYFRFEWQLIDPAGANVMSGLDVGGRDADGRFSWLVGFFGPTPQLPE